LKTVKRDISKSPLIDFNGILFINLQKLLKLASVSQTATANMAKIEFCLQILSMHRTYSYSIMTGK